MRDDIPGWDSCRGDVGASGVDGVAVVDVERRKKLMQITNASLARVGQAPLQSCHRCGASSHCLLIDGLYCDDCYAANLSACSGSGGCQPQLDAEEAVRLMLEAAQHAQWNSWDEALKRLERKHGVVLVRVKK